MLPLPEGIDRELILRLLLVREAAATTAIGDGIALPHVRNPIVLHVDRPMITLCFLERAVDFGALDGKPVQFLFSLICPTTRNHLQMLSRLSFALQDPQFKAVILRHGSRDEILGEARRIDAALAPRHPRRRRRGSRGHERVAAASGHRFGRSRAAWRAAVPPPVQRRAMAGHAAVPCSGRRRGWQASACSGPGSTSRSIHLPWAVPGGEFYVGIDAISAVFLLPIFLVSLLGNIYGLGYWKQAEHAENGRKLRLFYGTLTAGMALLGDRPQRRAVPLRLGDHGPFGLLPGDDGRPRARRFAAAVGSTWWRPTRRRSACSRSSACCGRPAVRSRWMPLDADSLSPGMATAIFVWPWSASV